MEGNTLISEFTNSVHSSATSELLVYVAERDILGDILRPARKLSFEAHDRQETPLSVDRIDRLLLLKILALESMNGFAVSQRLKQVSGDVLQVSDGSLYPALHKLEQEGWITAEWKTSEHGRRAKYYSLTRLGRRQLEKEADHWDRISSAISRVIKLKEA